MFRKLTCLRTLISAALVAFMSLVAPALAADRTVTFQAISGDVLNPERGFYRGYTSSFATTVDDEIASFRSEGSTLVYAPVRLDAYRASDLPDAFLKQLDAKFSLVRKNGLKVALRFAYNYPDNEFDYLNAKDASLAVVKRHIAQLAPTIARNRDVIAVLHTGFIGAWGEGHTSSNRLDTPANKRAVITELLAKMPKDLQILWRYPADLISWRSQKLASVSRVGLHNDCFMSSPTDVGTYSETAAVRDVERRQSAAISKSTFYMGETCAAEPTEVRTDCASILREGKQFNVSSLNRDYYEAFIRSWKANGCYPTVERSLGYRLRITRAVLSSANVLSVTITNEGWARPLAPRRINLLWRSADGAAKTTKLGTSSVRALTPGSTITYRAQLSKNTGAFCLAAPDLSASLAKDPRYAIRFANANASAKGQSWNSRLGRFCFKM
jgi:Domain of unknown function (DUF4874)/Domain of unknown function (DUF4832)